MILIKKLEIHNFRGVRDLTLDLDSKSFAIGGRNGTGKSGIIDAIEFALTGSISRLSGSGSAGVSIKQHGPHVDYSSVPSDSSVGILIEVPSMDGLEISIVRSVDRPRTPTLVPNTAQSQSVMAWLGDHPEFALSRRELVQLIVATSGSRSDQVSSLLRLEDIDKIRGLLQKIRRADEVAANASKDRYQGSQRSLQLALGIATDTEPALLAAVNSLRVQGGLVPLDDFGLETDILQGLPVGAMQASISDYRQVWLDQIATLKADYELARDEIESRLRAITTTASAFLSDRDATSSLAARSFLESALELFNDAECPACQTLWDPTVFRRNVSLRVEKAKAASASIEKIRVAGAGLSSTLRDFHGSMTDVCAWSGRLITPESASALEDARENVRQLRARLESVGTVSDLTAIASAATPDLERLLPEIEALEAAVSSLPIVSAQATARAGLAGAGALVVASRLASDAFDLEARKAAVSASAADAFEHVRSEFLGSIFNDVQQLFARLYSAVNHDDESDFSATMVQTAGALSLDVAFYGRGNFPPNAYHSEGHQDGMGLCLYLALMKYTLGSGFTFAVLDDVVMSIDAGHRRDVVKMLLAEFPNTQFVITTHDEIWLEQMRAQGLVTRKQLVHFRGWDVQNGPTVHGAFDSFAEASELAADGNVRTAAGVLRRHLEHTYRTICSNLGAKITYRLDGHPTLGDLVPGAQVALKDAMKKAKHASGTWGDLDAQAVLTKWEQELSSAVSESLQEQWAINTAVHYNEWENFDASDFMPVLKSFESLSSQFECETCHSQVWLSGPDGKPEVLRCQCNAVSFNLVQKPKSAA